MLLLPFYLIKYARNRFLLKYIDCREKRMSFIIWEWKISRDNKHKTNPVRRTYTKHEVFLPIILSDKKYQMVSINNITIRFEDRKWQQFGRIRLSRNSDTYINISRVIIGLENGSTPIWHPHPGHQLHRNKYCKVKILINMSDVCFLRMSFLATIRRSWQT